MMYRATHTTIYDYPEPVSLCHNLAHLAPRPAPWQTCLGTDLVVTPEPAAWTKLTDFFGNPAVFFALQTPHRRLTITARHRLLVGPRPAPVPADTPPWETVRNRLRTDRAPEMLDACRFKFDSRYVQAHRDFAAYAAVSFTPGRPMLEALLDLTGRIHREFTYDPRATTVATPLAQVFAERRGVCQDFAHLQIACLRSLGLAARYISGYLCTTRPGEERLIGADATHAWLSACCGDAGWLEADPTNDQMPSTKHLILAWGRDYEDVSPIKGVVLGGGKHTVSVSVDVAPVPPEAQNGDEG
jgi:transglutaminase-like putative cysteine protease